MRTLRLDRSWLATVEIGVHYLRSDGSGFAAMAQFELPDRVKRQLVDGVLAALDKLGAKEGEPDRWELLPLARAVSSIELGAYGNAMKEITLSAKRPAERDTKAEKAANIETDTPESDTIEALRERLRAVKVSLEQ